MRNLIIYATNSGTTKEIAEEINISQAEISKRLFEISQIVKTHF